MLLAIDAGNTNVVFALVDGRDIRTRWRIATDPRRTADEYAVWINQLLALEGFAMADVHAVIIATVVPRALHNLQVLASKYFKVEALVAGRAPVEWDIRLDVPQPETVGADRAVNAIAAHAEYPDDLIVIDFGTATTFDHIDYNGAYKGGIIAPGINLSLDALVAAAAKLPRIGIAAPATDVVIGRTTEDQMLIGVFWGYVALMEGLVARMRTEIGRPVKVIATGGLAVIFDERTDLFDAIIPDLTINGLAILYERIGTTTS
jgi:type III pantothenate kinase